MKRMTRMGREVRLESINKYKGIEISIIARYATAASFFIL